MEGRTAEGSLWPYLTLYDITWNGSYGVDDTHTHTWEILNGGKIPVEWGLRSYCLCIHVELVVAATHIQTPLRLIYLLWAYKCKSYKLKYLKLLMWALGLYWSASNVNMTHLESQNIGGT